ncbi:MAG: hypothetical protein QW327_01300 [Candidatus Odinarchaeota archaeon]
MNKKEWNTIYAIIISAIIVTSSTLAYTLINPPQTEKYASISVLNSDYISTGKITVQNNTQFTFYCLVQNRLGTTANLTVEILQGIITNNTNPSFTECTPWDNKTITLPDQTETLIPVTDKLNTTTPYQVYIYYLKLHIYNPQQNKTIYTGQWVAIQVNVTVT